jgi:hypothetical protein
MRDLIAFLHLLAQNEVSSQRDVESSRDLRCLQPPYEHEGAYILLIARDANEVPFCPSPPANQRQSHSTPIQCSPLANTEGEQWET